MKQADRGIPFYRLVSCKYCGVKVWFIILAMSLYSQLKCVLYLAWLKSTNYVQPLRIVLNKTIGGVIY